MGGLRAPGLHLGAAHPTHALLKIFDPCASWGDRILTSIVCGRETEGGTLTGSSVCHGSQQKLVTIAAQGQVNLTQINETVHSAISSLPENSFKPSFFVEQAIRAAEAESPMVAGQNRKATGGFREVGDSATSEALPTCWPLLEQVFHHLMQQVRATQATLAAPESSQMDPC